MPLSYKIIPSYLGDVGVYKIIPSYLGDVGVYQIIPSSLGEVGVLNMLNMFPFPAPCLLVLPGHLIFATTGCVGVSKNN